ncbi:MAG: SCO family protein [Burkholderiaceae bacterium]|jgi:protein SCO1/2|nr:MAG: SCO family protein [Burkholderiaceae bacterium]
MMNKRDTLRWISVGLAATGLVPLLAACSKEKLQFKNIDITGADFGKDFHLTDQNGQPRSLEDFHGKVVVVFFGYTSCPDVCPTTLAELAQVKKLLGSDGDRLQVLFITIDPERDTPQLLKAYMANFDPSFLALRCSPEQLVTLARNFKIFYKKVDGKTPDSYTMDHSAGCYVYDPQGRLRLYLRYGADPQAIASDVRLLLQT